LGSPFQPASPFPCRDDFIKLTSIASKNRILYFYLTMTGSKPHDKLLHIFYKEQAKFRRTNYLISRISKILTEGGIEYAFFKTIRPYISTTVDLDILIFGESEEYIKSITAIKNAGYKLLTYGPLSTTFLDEEANIGIDLYREVAVSFITYIDKKTLYPYITTMKLSNGEKVKILKPEADLACIIVHSVIKEQMYTLSEYYTFIYYLKQMNIKDFIHVVKQNNVTSAARTHTSITALLHEVAHKTIPEKLQQITESLGKDYFEITRLTQNNFETPHKYHPITVVKALLEIVKVKKCRDSMALQIYRMLNPRFTNKFLKDLLKHIKRETY